MKSKMKFNFMGKKKLFLLLAAVAVFAAGAAGVTFALLEKKTDTASNEFTSGAVNVGVVENGVVYESGDSENGNVNDGFAKVTSGEAIIKTVAVKNIDKADYPTADTFVRVRLVPGLVYDAGSDYAGQIAAVDMRGRVKYEFADTAHWRYSGFGDERYFYYTQVLEPGETTGNLIQSVTYTGELPEGTHFELKVLVEGIAARQTVQGKSSLSVWGLESFETLNTLD